MILYTTQALFLGVLLWCVTLSNRRTDPFITAYVCVWTIGVIALYWKFGIAQNVFYSNDQVIQVGLVDHVSHNPLVYSLRGIVGLRYVITIPASLLTRIGIDTLLALKFLQAIFFILTYRLVQEHFRINNLKFKLWYIALFCGPLFIFMSVLGLRDLVLAYFALTLMVGRDVRMHALSWLGLFLLRPHLAIALVFGWLFGHALDRARLNFHLLLLPLIVVFSFISGTYAYVIGRFFQVNGPMDFNSLFHLWSQSAFVRVFANFGGLQFLLFGPEIVDLSVLKLILLRILFFDTFLIPLLFVWTLISSSRFQKHSVRVLASFVFYLGIASTTEFNSSRQNIPFLVLMGVSVVIHLARRTRFDPIELSTESMKHTITATRPFRGC